MTHNLPARPADPGEAPISDVPTPTLIFTLGFVVANPAQAHKHYGGIAAIADELSQRHRARPDGSAIPTTEFAALMQSLPRRIAAAVETMYRADRGQRMAGTGVHRPSSGNSVR